MYGNCNFPRKILNFLLSHTMKHVLNVWELCVFYSFYVVVDNRVPFNANLYLVPFAIVVGICFVLMLAFMVAKWVRDIRKRRRARLSKEHLKKLPVKKFKKGKNIVIL